MAMLEINGPDADSHEAEEEKSAANGAASEPTIRVATTTIQQLDLNDMESISVIDSKLSSKTGRTTSGAKDKHCHLCDNKKYSGPNWNKHDKVHRDKGISEV